MISTFSRTRVQSLVLALVSWCLAVFVFDLVALGLMVSTKFPVAAQEIEMVCDATHVNAAADLHSDFDNVADRKPRVAEVHTSSTFGWLALNPVDLFRATNLPRQLEFSVPPLTTVLAITLWLGGTLGATVWKLRRTDL